MASGPPSPLDTDRDILAWLTRPEEAPELPGDGSVRIVRAVGEVNEIRGVLRDCLADDVALDEVELLHTDTGTYVPLVFETLSPVDHFRRPIGHKIITAAAGGTGTCCRGPW